MGGGAMTTVRGKVVNVDHTPVVEAQPHSMKVRVSVIGFAPNEFTVVGHLSPECCAIFIKRLRSALRTVRDHQVKRLNEAVSDAEGPL